MTGKQAALAITGIVVVGASGVLLMVLKDKSRARDKKRAQVNA